MEQSAEWDPARAGGEFFADPQHATQRRYEALRAYLYEGYSATEVAGWFGYSPQTVRTLVRDFRAGRDEFFVDARRGPKHSPAKDAVRPGDRATPRPWPVDRRDRGGAEARRSAAQPHRHLRDHRRAGAATDLGLL